MSEEKPKRKRAPAKPKAKRGIGRPSLYDPSFCERIETMGAEGLSVIEMAVELGISKATLYRYADEIQEFQDAFTCAREKAEAHHARIYRTRCGAPQSEFNANGYAKYMGICFKDWRDPTKVEVTGAEGGPLVISWLTPSPA